MPKSPKRPQPTPIDPPGNQDPGRDDRDDRDDEDPTRAPVRAPMEDPDVDQDRVRRMELPGTEETDPEGDADGEDDEDEDDEDDDDGDDQRNAEPPGLQP